MVYTPAPMSIEEQCAGLYCAFQDSATDCLLSAEADTIQRI